jgi:hypothetical protein
MLFYHENINVLTVVGTKKKYSQTNLKQTEKIMPELHLNSRKRLGKYVRKKESWC